MPKPVPAEIPTLPCCLLFAMLLLQACSAASSTPATADASDAGNAQPDVVEAATPDPDANSSDIMPNPVDGDAGCTCSLVDDPDILPTGKVRQTSLPCLCARRYCPDSPAEARTRAMNGTGGVVKTYETCGLLEYRFRFGPGFNDTRWIFELTSGTLVAHLWDGDVCDVSCGCTTRAGIFPSADCAVTSVETLCSRFGSPSCADASDAHDTAPDGNTDGATPDADADADADGSLSDGTANPVDGDAGCMCTPVQDPEIFPPGSLRETSLPCLCAMHSCPASPTDARAQVTNSGARSAFVKTYEPCGLLEYRFRFGPGFNDTRWIFDLTSGTLVGHLWDGDLCDATCGCTTRAGLFPAANCVVTSTEPLCPKFGPQPCADGGNDGS